MLFTQKNHQEYNTLAERVINYAQKSGYEDIKADFTGYDSPAALTMVNQDVSFTPDFTAQRNGKKFYFELVMKNSDENDNRMLISKWKALEAIARIKGGFLQLFVPNGSFKFATSLIKDNGIEAKLVKISSI